MNVRLRNDEKMEFFLGWIGISQEQMMQIHTNISEKTSNQWSLRATLEYWFSNNTIMGGKKTKQNRKSFFFSSYKEIYLHRSAAKR